MAKNQNSLVLNMKFEIMCLCEVGSLPKSKLERQYTLLTSLTLFMMLKKRKYGVY
jgi:hypothetical protein